MISRVFKPPVNSKGVPSSLDKGKGVETIADPLSQKKDVRLKTKEAKKGTLSDESSMQVSRNANHMTKTSLTRYFTPALSVLKTGEPGN